MENELIKIITNENGENTISARDLHEFLDVKRYFTQWIEPYIKENNEYGFEENVDFTRINVDVNPTNGINIINYALTVDMAKELSMLSKSEKGKEARKYFIKCEKKLKGNNQLMSARTEIKELKSTLEDFKKATEEAKHQYKPSHKRKLDYNRLIKSVVNTDEEAKVVKDWCFGLLGITKWEDTCIDDSKRILEVINTVARLLTIKKIEQITFLQ
jgi:phage anti-repressor protein